MKKKLSSITITLLLVVMLVSTAFAADSREFQLKGTLDASETQQVVFPTANINLTGTGNATHLGLYHIQFASVSPSAHTDLFGDCHSGRCRWFHPVLSWIRDRDAHQCSRRRVDR
jgi:hypothetical protein